MTKGTLIKDSIYLGWLTVSKVQSIMIMLEDSSIQGDKVLEKELRVLHLDLQAAEGDCVPH